MNIKDNIKWGNPSIYDILWTVCIVVALILMVGIRLDQKEIKASQTQMQRDYITKDYIYNFYITRDQIMFMEEIRPLYLKRVLKGEDYEKVNKEFYNAVESSMKLRDRGL